MNARYPTPSPIPASPAGWLRRIFLALVMFGVWTLASGQTVLFEQDFEASTPGEQPLGDWTFSPSSNTAGNGAVVVDATTTPANPLSGQSLYVYDLIGDGTSGESTHIRTEIAGGENVSAARASFTFQRMYATDASDEDTRVHFTLGAAGLSMNNSDFRLFEFRMYNNGDLRVEYSRDGAGGDRGSEVVGTYDTGNPNTAVFFINSHGSADVGYNDGTLSGSLAPNTMDVYLNGAYLGTYLTLKTPDPTNAPQIDFWASDADLGQIAFYQDSKRQGGIVIDDIEVTEIEVLPMATLFEQDFEASTPGEQPLGDWTFSPSSNTAGNGAVVVDATTTPANPLSGQSLYVYDLIGDGTSGESTHIRTEIAGGENVSAARASFTFQRMYATDASDEDTRVHFTLGAAGLSMNNSDFRLFEFRMYNNGDLRVEYSRDGAGGDRGSEVVGTYDTGNPNTAVFFINSHGSADVGYNDGTLSGSLAPNTMDVYLNGAYLGTYLTLKTPDPTNAPQIDFWASDADLGQIAFYQDSKRQGGIVIDDLHVAQLPVGGAEEPLEPVVYIDLLDFEDDTVGQQPVMPFPTSFTPSSNTSGNGFVIVDGASMPANPMATGQALYAYDLVGDLVSGESTHMRFDFEPADTDNVRVDLDFQRMYEVPVEDEDTRMHVAVAPAGTSTNNSDFRPFEIRIQNNGSLVVNYNPTGALLEGRESETVAQYETTGTNSLTFFANGNNATSLPYADDVLGSGTVPPNTMILFLNGVKIGEYGFINTPDPVNAPNIAFFETSRDFGRFGIYQDSKRQGGIAFDNLSIREFAKLGAPNSPGDLVATSNSPTSISLTWTDNSDNETGFVVQQLEGADWIDLVTTEADVTAYEVTGLLPETAYTFRVRSTNGTLSDPSNEATATTEQLLTPLILSDPEGQLLASGETTTLSVSASGPEPLSYQWYTGDSGDTSNPVEGATGATFTTPALTVTTLYWVRVSNNAGFDDSAAALIEVFEPRTVRIVSIEQLVLLLPDALPGDTYVIDAGTYPDSQISIDAMGTANAPVTIKAERPGEVVFTGDSYLRVGGDWVIVEGFLFTDGWNQSLDQVISFRTSSRQATNSRVTQCAIIGYSPPDPSIDRDWIGLYGFNNRFDHNLLSGHSNKGVTLVVWRQPGVADYHSIDHNHFRDRGNGGGENGWETIRIGTSSDSLSNSFCVVEHNLFEACDGEVEIISNKSGENIYRYNTFWRSKGMLTLRHGDNCLVDGNIFLGDGVSDTGGIRVIGENHVIVNNYIEGTTGRQGGAIAVYAGVPDSPLNEYFAAHNAYVANNTIVDVLGAHVLVGAGYETSNRTVLPAGVVVDNNLSARVNALSASYAGPAIAGAALPDAAYAGNVVSAVEVGGEVGGFAIADVAFSFGPYGLLRPDLDSAVVDASVNPLVLLDIDGQPRDSFPDVGADELTDEPGVNIGGPLLAHETGPAWRDRVDTVPPWIGAGLVAGNSVNSPWFGEFMIGGTSWILHARHGWLYENWVTSTQNMWLWSDPLQQWIWTNRDYFPYFYDPSRTAWIYFIAASSGGAYVYDYGQGAWVWVP